jgi:putative integral membrane protein (TIGR02587 family)
MVGQRPTPTAVSRWLAPQRTGAALAIGRLEGMRIELERERVYLRDLARAAASALIFSFPLLMTMEMWQLAIHMDRLKLALFLVVIGLVTFGLSRFAGFRDDTTFADDVLDALAALMVGFVVSALLLALMGLFKPGDGLRQVVGMVAIQAAPASIGAVLANKQLRRRDDGESKEDRAGYLGQLFLMAAGALFFGFNVAPTEEMILIGFKMTPWHCAAMVIVSVALLHALVFSVGFAGQADSDHPGLAFLHFTLAGYGLALIVSAYVLWTFGRFGPSLGETLQAVIVLGFPAALGAAVARLVV